MIKAIEAAEKHLIDLANDRVPAKEKPSAFHHGLITELLRVTRIMQQDVISADQYSTTAGFVVDHCESKYVELQNELADATGRTLEQIREKFPLPSLDLPPLPTTPKVDGGGE